MFSMIPLAAFSGDKGKKTISFISPYYLPFVVPDRAILLYPSLTNSNIFVIINIQGSVIHTRNGKYAVFHVKSNHKQLGANIFSFHILILFICFYSIHQSLIHYLLTVHDVEPLLSPPNTASCNVINLKSAVLALDSADSILNILKAECEGLDTGSIR